MRATGSWSIAPIAASLDLGEEGRQRYGHNSILISKRDPGVKRSTSLLYRRGKAAGGSFLAWKEFNRRLTIWR
ncbi:hypothetical protein JMJ77_0014949, partial [Colletotrichum scovillei]